MSNGQPAQRTGFPYANRAVVEIDGTQYYEWETVAVRLAIFEKPANTFRFTCSEASPPGQDWAAMRIIPGQKCTIFLDGYVAITGEVVTRQVYYDANQHTVEIQGQGLAGRLAEANVVSQTHEWNKITFNQLARVICSPFGIGCVGSAVKDKVFDRISANPSETYWELLERHARATATPMGETTTGQLALNPQGGGASAIEGSNILIGREVIHSLKAVGEGMEGGDFTTTGQRPGTDDSWGAEANQVHAEAPPITSDFGKGFLPKVGMHEIPGWSTDALKDRSKFEGNFADTLQIWVTCTLLGWQRNGTLPPQGGLWTPGQPVSVYSPMLIMYSRTLKLKAVTFTQDNQSGTRSTVELVNSLALGGEPGAGPGPSGASDATGGGQIESPA